MEGSAYLEAIVPRAGILALALRTGTDAVTVRLALLPAADVRAAVVKVEPAAVHDDGRRLDASRPQSYKGRRYRRGLS